MSVVADDSRVNAFYTLALVGSVAKADAPGRFRRNMSEPIQVVVLVRLAVAHSLHGRGIGQAPFADAAGRVVEVPLPTSSASAASSSTPSQTRRGPSTRVSASHRRSTR